MAVRQAPSHVEHRPWWRNENCGSRRNIGRHDSIRTDPRIISDRDRAEDDRAAAYLNTTSHGRCLQPTFTIQGAKGDILTNDAIVTNHHTAVDHNPGWMREDKPSPNDRAGFKIDGIVISHMTHHRSMEKSWQRPQQAKPTSRLEPSAEAVYSEGTKAGPSPVAPVHIPVFTNLFEQVTGK